MSNTFSRRAEAALAVAVVAALVVAACGGGGGGPAFPVAQRGNNLSVTVNAPVDLRDVIYYQQDDTTYAVRPTTPGNKLALVDATVRNDRSTSVIMNVDEKGYTLLDEKGTEYKSLNPFKVRELAPTKPQTEPFYTFIWGNFTIPETYGIRAWAVFEVPPEIQPAQFRWDTVDTVYVRFGTKS